MEESCFYKNSKNKQNKNKKMYWKRAEESFQEVLLKKCN